jgi:hypothetical protein
LSEKEFGRFQAASDVGMMVAIAKTLFFNLYWEDLAKLPKVKSLGPKDFEMLQRHMKGAVPAMDDTLFFFPPDVVGSENALRKAIGKLLNDDAMRLKFLQELNKRLAF